MGSHDNLYDTIALHVVDALVFYRVIDMIEI